MCRGTSDLVRDSLDDFEAVERIDGRQRPQMLKSLISEQLRLHQICADGETQ